MRSKLVWTLVVALLALAAPSLARADAVTDWNRVTGDTLLAVPGPAGGAPPALAINMAMVQGAVYDAVNSIERTHQPYLLGALSSPFASKDTAVAKASADVLTWILTTAPPFATKPVLLQRVADAYAAAVPAVPDAAQAAGIAAGTAAADAMIAARTNDGRFGPSQWTMATGIGYWEPLQPNGTSPLDSTPWVGGVTPFLITSSSQFRTDGPNALTSEAYATDFNEVKALGSATSTMRTQQQTADAAWWQSPGGGVLLWDPVARTLAERPLAEGGLDIDDSALLFAMLSLGTADSSISCWNDKYHYDFWRPWTAIRHADVDGNPATEADPSWAPLITAPYPEHPSGHLAQDGAMIPVLQSFFGDKVTFDVKSLANGRVRTFDRFSLALREIIDARIWAGLHFRTADVQSVVMARQIVHYMDKHYFQPAG
jgi:hypothetical protein